MALIRYTFDGILRAEGALHIGSGGGGRVGIDDTLTDAAIIRDSQGRPYVPGSSLRGVLRAAVGQLAPSIRAIGEEGAIREDELIANAVKQLNLSADLSESEQQERLDKELSIAERLFGTVFWASPLLIPDLPLQLSRTEYESRSEIRHGVGIDRDTGAARDGVKYDFEVLPRETAFKLWMRCDIPEQPREYLSIWEGLLALALQLLQQGELTLGGRAARGVGQVRLTDLTVYRLTFGGQSLLDALLAPPDSSARYGEAQPGWVEQRLKELRDVRKTTE